MLNDAPYPVRRVRHDAIYPVGCYSTHTGNSPQNKPRPVFALFLFSRNFFLFCRKCLAANFCPCAFLPVRYLLLCFFKNPKYVHKIFIPPFFFFKEFM